MTGVAGTDRESFDGICICTGAASCLEELRVKRIQLKMRASHKQMDDAVVGVNNETIEG